MDNVTLHFALATRIMAEFGGQTPAAWDFAAELLETPPATPEEARDLFVSLSRNPANEARYDELVAGLNTSVQ